MLRTPLRELEDCGQSVWLDSISRELIHSGTFGRLIDQDGISGVTANPSIFDKAISGSHDYDTSIRELAGKGLSPIQIYERLAIEDVGTAADMLRSTFDACDGCDGFASIEVSPNLAYDTQASIEEAHRFWDELHRPNIMVKIPATNEGIPAIESLIAGGINVNITLIFGLEMYGRVMEAFLTGLERRIEHGQPIDHVASVASFFVSRVDTLVDRRLEEQLVERAEAGGRKRLIDLQGKTAVANAKIAYESFQEVFESDRFHRLQSQGGQIQRPLWASTSTKNPRYSDTLYVAPLIGPHTVNTMPLETIDAFRSHGVVDCASVTQGRGEAHEQMSELERAGLSMKGVTDELIREGVDKFCKALHSLLDTIRQRQGALVEV